MGVTVGESADSVNDPHAIHQRGHAYPGGARRTDLQLAVRRLQRLLVYGADMEGWPTLAAGIMLFSGVQLMSIGILGEYIGRIYEEVKRRPPTRVNNFERDKAPFN